jgi:hypothetical protein
MAINPWTAEELRLLIAWRANKIPFADIAVKLGRSRFSVEDRWKRIPGDEEDGVFELELESAKLAQRKLRRCLKCGSDFDSENIGNRICEGCSQEVNGMSHAEGLDL